MPKVLSSTIFLVALLQPAFAAPLLSNVSVSPAEAWLGQGVLLSAACTDNKSSVSRVYAEITGPVIPPALDFSQSGDTYFLAVPAEYLSLPGTFNSAVYCVSPNGTANVNATFSVSNFSTMLSSVSPSPAYAGDTVEADFFAKKDSAYLSSGVAFNVSLNGAYVALSPAPYYIPGKGWILKFSPPAQAGTYTLAITAFYGGTSSSVSGQLEVRDVFTFVLSGIDKPEVLAGDNVTATLSAANRGTAIVIDKNRISAKVGSYDAVVSDVYADGGYYKAKIIMPSLSAGRYDMKITFNYGNFTAERTTQVNYMVPASGRLLDAGGSAVQAAVSFLSGSLERTARTDSQGRYSLNIPSGSYDVKLSHDKATIILYGVSVSEFNDPLRFYYLPDAGVAGIRSAGLFVFETALSSPASKITMSYDEGKVSREDDISVYKCSGWNSAKKICTGSWDKIIASLDTVRNTLEISPSGPSGAYLAGTVDALSLDFSLDKSAYFSGDAIRVTGITQNAERIPVGDAEVTARMLGSAASKTVKSSSEGIFSLDIPVPTAEGNYTVIVAAKRDPYTGYSANRTISVSKSREIAVIVPETVRVNVGENSTVEVSVVNTGQAALSDAAVSLSGAPQEYFSIAPSKISVDAGAEKKFFINFIIPPGAPKTTYGLDLEIPFGEKAFKKTFALTITDSASKTQASGANITASAAGFFDTITFPTGFATATLGYDIAYLVMLSLASFSAAIFLRRRRLGRAPSFDAENFKRRTYLLEIKKAVERGFGKQLKSAARKRGLASRKRRV